MPCTPYPPCTVRMVHGDPPSNRERNSVEFTEKALRRPNMKWNILWIAALLSISVESHAGRPDWTREPPEGVCFEYFVGMGGSRESEWKARRGAIKGALGEIAMSERVQIRAEALDIMREENGEVYEKFVSEIAAEGRSSLIQGLRVKEVYWEPMGEGYKYWALVRVPKVVGWEECKERRSSVHRSIQSREKLASVWRSALVPGWGQFYRERRTRGWFFLTSESTLVTTALFTGWLSYNEDQKASRSRSPSDRRHHRDLSDLSLKISAATWIAAIGLHIYNIFDVLAAPEADFYAGTNKVGDRGFLAICVGKAQIELTYRFCF